MRPHLKRWTGVCAGWVLSFEKAFQDADGVRLPESNTSASGNRERADDPAESETPCMYRKLHAREPGDLVIARRQYAGRRENAMSGKSLMHGGEESYSGVVPAKQPNKSERSPAEVAEGRPLTKENTQEPNPCRTPSRKSGPTGLARVRWAYPNVRLDVNIRGRNRVR